MARKLYDDGVKQQALELYATEGGAAASAATGVPRGTIKSWASRLGVDPPAAERSKARRDAVVARVERTVAERKVALVTKLGEVAEMGVDWAARMLESGDDLSMRDVVGAWTRAIHDLQLLAGDATSRTETMSGDAQQRIEAATGVLDELAKRRATAA